MPQSFQVLRCFACHIFQVHQVKKSLKWNCKLCGEKQSIRKVYSSGSGADCRQHVQKLNALQGSLADTRLDQGHAIPAMLHEEGSLKGCLPETETSLPNHSKWAQYVSDDEDTQEEEVCSENATYTIDRREFKKCSRQAKQSANRKRKYGFTFVDEEEESYSNLNPDDYGPESLIGKMFAISSRFHTKLGKAGPSQTSVSHSNSLEISPSEGQGLPQMPKSERICDVNKSFAKRTVTSVPVKKSSKWDKFVDESDNGSAEEDVSGDLNVEPPSLMPSKGPFRALSGLTSK